MLPRLFPCDVRAFVVVRLHSARLSACRVTFAPSSRLELRRALRVVRETPAQSGILKLVGQQTAAPFPPRRELRPFGPL